MSSIRTGLGAAALATLTALTVTVLPTGAATATDTGLRAAARGTGTKIGTAVDMTALANDAPYAAAVAREFDTVTPENVMKWAEVEPTQGTYNWGPADDLIRFARKNGQAVRGHTLVWHSQNPSWLTEANFTPAQLKALLRKHIFDEVGHFKGKIWAWDVANEVFNEDGTPRDTIWLRALGPGYIADAFRWAHQADPSALLFLNDYNVDWLGPKSDAYYALITSLRAQGVPVQGFGMQGHLGIQYGLPGDVLENVRRFDALGVKTAFTEVDIRMIMPADSTEVQAQAEGFGLLLRACLLVRNCVSYTVWGFTDKYSWVPGVFPTEGSATPFDEQLQPKPAYDTLRETFLLAK
ncbi:endo-1,4-beta-xylanase [Paractinoplanes durhamensis]|uniref:Beta-xylanase n=1 Tax=Paractinoplanes durhamensis TaxID=113563 RepID=A0ABQ3YS59_9ACTN|nr:endo-1,4-beta-xylanase [Actinoplanes durhamensis]GIE00428.1 beta-xylanase [Actinoplanes durhamensis]